MSESESKPKEILTPAEAGRRAEPRHYPAERERIIRTIQDTQGEPKAPLLEPVDPHFDLEAMDSVALEEERRRLWTKAANNYSNLDDFDLGRITRCNALCRSRGTGGPPAAPKRPSAKRLAAVMPADLSDIPE